MLRGVLHHGLSMENLIYKLKQGATGTLALFVKLYDILTSRHLEHARNDVLRSTYSPMFEFKLFHFAESSRHGSRDSETS